MQINLNENFFHPSIWEFVQWKIKNAIKQLKNGWTPVVEGNPAELIKYRLEKLH